MNPNNNFKQYWVVVYLLCLLPIWATAQGDNNTQKEQQRPTVSRPSGTIPYHHRQRFQNYTTRTTDSHDTNTLTGQGGTNSNDNNNGDINLNRRTAGEQSAHNVTTGTDYVYRGNENCAKLFSDVHLPELKVCSLATATIGYCNHGNVDANNAYIDVTLPPALTLDSTTLPYVHQGGQTYRFYIGTIPTNFCSSFELWAKMSCDNAYTGHQLCINSHIYPDTLCEGLLPQTPTLLVDGICMGQTTKFLINNQGRDIAANDHVRFIVTEDHLLTGGSQTIIHQATLVLPSNGIVTEQFTPSGFGHSNYRMEVRDANNRLIASSVVQRCLPGISSNTINYYNPEDQLWNGSVIPAIANGCAIVGHASTQANRGSYPVYGGSTTNGSGSPLGHHDFTQVRIAPNPMEQQAIVQIQHAEASDYIFELYSATGQRVYTRRISNATSFVLDRRNWLAGMYYYRIASTQGESVYQGKILLR